MEDIQNIIIENLSKGLANRFDEIFIEGLKRKGFIFESRAKLNEFVCANCKCEDNQQLEEKIFYVNNIPFLLHIYKIDCSDINFVNDEVRLTATYGSYAYL